MRRGDPDRGSLLILVTSRGRHVAVLERALSIDGKPVDLVFLLLSPPDAGAEHLKALAAVSRVTRHAATLEKMRGARSRDALAAVLMGADERDAA